MTTLHAKLTAALAGTTSQNPINTETLARGHSLRATKAILNEMYEAREACFCVFCKGGITTVSWWAPGNVMSANYNQTIKANKRAKARAAKLLDGDGDE